MDTTQVQESNRTEHPPGSPFQSKGLDETERPGGVQLHSFESPEFKRSGKANAAV